MSKKHFQSFFESLEILNKEDHAPVEKGALDTYEKQTGFQLPQSYRDFIQVFGPGMLTDETYHIAAPGRDPEEEDLFDLAGLNAFAQVAFEEDHEPGDSVLRLHFFLRGSSCRRLYWLGSTGRDRLQNTRIWNLHCSARLRRRRFKKSGRYVPGIH